MSDSATRRRRSGSPPSPGIVDNQGKRHRPPSLTSRIISVDTSRAKSNAEVVRQCIDQFGWKDYPEGRKDGRQCDIHWHNIVYSDMKEIVYSGCKVNKFPGMNELSKKISLTRALSSMQKLFPSDFDFLPKSWFIPAQLDSFYEDYYALLEQRVGKLPWFIVKPDEGAQGCGIYLIHSPEQLQNLDQPQLIQEYIADPFLFQDNLKFDFRVYALIRSINPLSIYVSREGMARFCTKKYRSPSISNSDQVFMHLTNYSLNKTNQDGYVHSNSLGSQGSKRLLSTVFHQMDSRGVNTRKLWHKIKLIIVKTVLAMVPELILHYENHFNNGQTSLQGPQCFHIIGFDVLLTKKLDPILLEINACPSLSLGHEPDKDDPTGSAGPTRSVVDEAIKVPLVRDTLLLVMNQGIAKESRLDSAASLKSQHSMDDSELPNQRKLSLREIFPGRYGQNCGHFLILDKAAYIFMQIIAIRRTLTITMSGCRTFVKKCYLSDVIASAELDLLYCKVQKNWQGQGLSGIPFHGFVHLLMEISALKYPKAQNLLEAFQFLLHFCQTKLRHSGVRSARLRNETVEGSGDNSNGDGGSAKEIYLLPHRISGNAKKRSESAGKKLSGTNKDENTNPTPATLPSKPSNNYSTRNSSNARNSNNLRSRVGSGGFLYRPGLKAGPNDNSNITTNVTNITLPRIV